jgi:hypothetical protein
MSTNLSFFKILSIFLFPLICVATERNSASSLPMVLAGSQIANLTAPNFLNIAQEEWRISYPYKTTPIVTPHSKQIQPYRIDFFHNNTPQSSSMIKKFSVLMSEKDFFQIEFTFQDLSGLGMREIDGQLMAKNLAQVNRLSSPPIIDTVYQSSSYANLPPYSINEKVVPFLNILFKKNLIPFIFFSGLAPYIRPSFPEVLNILGNPENFSNYMNNIPPASINSKHDYISSLIRYLDLIPDKNLIYDLVETALNKISPLYVSSFSFRTNFPSLKESDQFFIALKFLKYTTGLFSSKQLSPSQNLEEIENSKNYIYLAIIRHLNSSEGKMENGILEEIFSDSPYKSSRADLIFYCLSNIESIHLSTLDEKSPTVFSEISSSLKTKFPDVFTSENVIRNFLIPSVDSKKDFISSKRENIQLKQKLEQSKQEGEQLKQRIAELTSKDTNNKRSRVEESKGNSDESQSEKKSKNNN